MQTPTQTSPHRSALADSMSLGRKLDVLFTYLKAGQEITLHGQTFVWLDNHITGERVNSDGETEYMGIDGLAIKATSMDMSTGATKPHYMGYNDIPFSHLRELVENLTEDQLLQMTAANALMGLNKKRILRGG